jgi:DNA-binding response OmpR family regulator
MRVLIAEDDPALANFVKKGLEAEHYAVDISSDGEQARANSAEFDYDMVVLDLNLPRLDGVAILRHLRAKKPSVPILVLTGRTRVEDRVQCLDLGADDYLAKPFSFSELSARIRALLRRSHLPVESVLAVDDLKLDRVERRVERAGRRIELTSKEFALLEYLMRNAGRRITRAMIIEHVWNLSFDTCTNVVDVYVNFASSQVDRRKIGQLASAIQVAFKQMSAVPVAAPEMSIEPRLSPISPGTLAKTSAVEDNLDDLRQEVMRTLSAEIARNEIALRTGPDGLIISLREIAFFDSGSAQVRPGSMSTFTHIAKILNEHSYRIRIEGHTDNMPIHNPVFASNWELSTSRATELIRLLIMQYGFSPALLSAAGYAQYHPIAVNDTKEGRAQNRRVDIVVLGKLRGVQQR